jgi:electron transport complex protein RnfC
MSSVATRTIPGLRLGGHKTEPTPELRSVGLPPRLFLPMHQHVGVDSVACVAVGDRVRAGQLLAEAGAYVGMRVHAPTSGVVESIGPTRASPALGTQIVLRPDGRDEWGERGPALAWQACAPAELHARVAAAGIVGLGGAGFPTHVKLREGASQRVATVIVNGVECEPGISCDDRLLQDRTEQVLIGARILMQAAGAESGIIAVKSGMRAAIARLTAVADPRIEVREVPPIYPAGGEKQLIYLLTGAEVPSGGLPIHVGVLMQNVATAAAVYRAVVLGEPLTSRIVTVTGAVPSPGNFEVLLGTPITHLVACAGGALCADPVVIVGGPMMGQRLDDPERPVIKSTNCILVRVPQQPLVELPCIRCGRCAEVCPVRLQPQALYRAARAGDLDRAQDLHLFDCIECGCCAYVCPSRIALVAQYRCAKQAVEAAGRADRDASAARARHTALIERRRRVADRASPTAGGAAQGASVEGVGERDYVRAAIERVRARRRSPRSEPGAGDEPGDSE